MQVRLSTCREGSIGYDRNFFLSLSGYRTLEYPTLFSSSYRYAAAYSLLTNRGNILQYSPGIEYVGEVLS
jgi:hypothetical protein